MKVSNIVKYYIPKKLNDVELLTSTVIGYMETGKTTLVKTILYYINKNENCLNIYTNDFRLLKKYDFKEYNDQKIINVFIDDAAKTFSRFSSSKSIISNIQDFVIIRHIIKKKLNKNVRINIFIAVQDYYLIKHFIRRTPILFIKPVIFHSKDELRLIKNILPYPYYLILNKLSKEVILRKNRKYYPYTLVKLIDKIICLKINKKEFDFDVILDYKNEEDEEVIDFNEFMQNIYDSNFNININID